MTEREPPNVHLALDARAENVVLVREVLAGLGDNVTLGGSLDDVKAAVSEACNNVVVHAYPGGEGPMEVDLRVLPGELRVVVRDSGLGTARRAEDDSTPGRGIGLAVIEALSTSMELRASPGQGVEVEMSFEIPDGGLARGGDGGAGMPAAIAASGVRVSMSPTEIANQVGLSQMYVSRLLRSSLERLRDGLGLETAEEEEP